MIDSLLSVLWILLDNAELLRDACWFAVAAGAWVFVGAFGLFVIWVFSG